MANCANCSTEISQGNLCDTCQAMVDKIREDGKKKIDPKRRQN